MAVDTMNVDVQNAIESLHASPATASMELRIRLCQECLDSVVDVSMEWAETAAVAKGLSPTSLLCAEDLLSGPGVVARQLQLTIQTLQAIRANGRPALPAKPLRMNNGQLSVPVFPTSGLFDSLTFMGIKGSVRLQPSVDESNIHGPHVGIASNERLSRLRLC